MTPTQFEESISQLTNEQYDALIQERMARLNPEQLVIVRTREVKKKERFEIIKKLASSQDEEAHERLLDALRDGDDFNCEHGRSYAKHCGLCGQIDHLMFPELFNEDGFRIEESEED